jgi:hypothetical protein
MRIPTTRRRSTIGAITLAVTLMLATTAGVSAGRQEAVDPSSMTPALNPSFDWECWRAGDTIVCDGERTTEYTAAEAIPCPDGGWIYATGSAQDTLRRVGDENGLALWTLGTTGIDDVLSRSPAFDGIVGRARGVWSDYYEYAVPGDLSSRRMTRRGFDVLVTIPGQGLIVLDAGNYTVDFEGNLLTAHGPHRVLEDVEGSFAIGCAALAAESS